MGVVEPRDGVNETGWKKLLTIRLRQRLGTVYELEASAVGGFRICSRHSRSDFGQLH